MIAHCGKQADGDSDTSDVFISTDAAVDPDASEGADKWILPSGEYQAFPPGIGVFRFQSSGTPTIKIMPSAKYHGKW
jgi:hypothetical protein